MALFGKASREGRDAHVNIGDGLGRMGAPRLEQGRPAEFMLGSFALSVLGHLAVGVLILTQWLPSLEFVEPEVYSITLESGRALGGVSQVPKDDKKSEVAPLKNVAASEEDQPTVDEKKPQKEKDPEPVEPEEAEVSLSEQKPTPVPPKPTPVVSKPTPVPAKPSPKPTVVPTKAPKKPKTEGTNTDKEYQNVLQRYTGESSNAGGKGFGSARAGVGSGMGGGKQISPEAMRYINLLQGRIKNAWRWYDTNTMLLTQVEFFIERDGRVRDISIVKTSGNGSFDESVVRAIAKVSPLPPPEESFYHEVRHMRPTFDPRNW
jgi:TonB family protein